ncbi:CatB-related O-acetyltransferase [bacterium]|nr:MAG: CatB-related O-acetyltransferase [bacterium]
MIIFSYLRNLFFNFFKLLKVAARSKNIYWNFLANNRKNCNIDALAKVFYNHMLDNVTVGKGTYIAQNSIIFNTSIGKFCSIGPNLVCGWGIHPINGISTAPAFYSTKRQAGFTFSKYDKFEEQKFTTIGNDVFIGMNVAILDGVSIGDGAIIGAGAVVSKNIPPYAIAVGSPIRIIKYRFSAEIIESLIKSKWWDQNEALLREVEKNFFEVEKFLQLIQKD